MNLGGEHEIYKGRIAELEAEAARLLQEIKDAEGNSSSSGSSSSSKKLTEGGNQEVADKISEKVASIAAESERLMALKKESLEKITNDIKSMASV